MNRKTIWISTLLLAGMLCAGVSCGDSDSGTVTDTDAVSGTAASTDIETAIDPALLPDLPEVTFNGANFNVLIWDYGTDMHSYFEFDVEAQNGELLNDAIFNRNFKIEEQYDVTISTIGEQEPCNRLKKDVMAGATTYQIIADWPTRLANISTTGALTDLNAVPHLDFSKPWWDRHASEAFTIGDKLYLTTGDYVLYDKQRVLVLFFNRSLAESFDIKNMYETVNEGKWTVDLFNTYCAMMSYDLNGNGKLGEQSDRFGIISGSSSYNPYLLFGCGSTYSKREEDGTFSLAIDSDHTITAIEALGKTLFDSNLTIYLDDISSDSSPLTMFEQGQALFYHEVSQIIRLIDMDDAFGVVPQPKLDETQKNYYSCVQNEYSAAIGIPSTVYDEELEMTGVLLEALSAASHTSTYPVFIEDIMQSKKAPDAESADILRMIHDNLVYDVYGVFQIGGIDKIVYENLYKKHGENFLSTIESRRDKIAKEYEKIVDKFVFME